MMTMMTKTMVTYISSLREMKSGLIPLQMDLSVWRRIICANQTEMKNKKTRKIGCMRSPHYDAIGLQSLCVVYQLRYVISLFMMG